MKQTVTVVAVTIPRQHQQVLTADDNAAPPTAQLAPDDQDRVQALAGRGRRGQRLLRVGQPAGQGPLLPGFGYVKTPSPPL